MAAFRARVYTQYGGKPFSALLARVENPKPLLEKWGQKLRESLLAYAPEATGTLRKGLEHITFYERRGARGKVWGIGIGDPAVLADWHLKAPPGTIAEFVRWLRAENAKTREAKGQVRAYQKAERAERGIQRRTRAAERRVAVERGRTAARAQFRSLVENILRGKVIEKGAFRNIARYRLFGKGRAGYAKLSRYAKQEAIRFFKRNPQLRGQVEARAQSLTYSLERQRASYSRRVAQQEARRSRRVIAAIQRQFKRK